jgi:hypothetical protein
VDSCDEPENGLCDRMIVGEPRQPARVYTVCEALASRNDIVHAQVVIVGILAPSPSKALHQTCDQTLITDEFIWPNSVALQNGLEPPAKELRGVIEEKVRTLLAREPGRKRLRRRDVVAFSGRFLAPAGIVSCERRNGCATLHPVRLSPAVLLPSTGADFQVFQ